MDYIQKELLRQKKILSALMTGGLREEPEENGSWRDETPYDRQTAIELGNRAHSGREPIEFPARLREQSRSSDRAGVNIRLTESHGGKAWRQRTDVLMTPERQDAPVRMVPYERAVPEVSADAREVSRSIQRDARRYDGGFSIY